MNRVSATAKAPSTPTEQTISATFHIEVMNDLESGEPMMLGSIDPHLGDLQVVTAAQVFEKGAETRKKVAEGEALALAFEAATRLAPAEPPHTWVAEEINTGKPLPFTCMTGCNSSHIGNTETPRIASEVACLSYDEANHTGLPVFCGDDDDEGPVLSTVIQVDHFHPDPARRIPYAAVEVIEDHHIEGLDPDGLAAVIDHFEQRVAAMRLRHAELVRARNEYLGRTA